MPAKRPETLPTLIDRLATLAFQVQEALERLAAESSLGHSMEVPKDGSMSRWIGSGARASYFQPLSRAGLLAQDDSFSAYRKFSELSQFVLRHGTGERVRRFENNAGVIHLLIDQVEESLYYDIAELLARCKRALQFQLEALSATSFRPASGRIFVPDTMAMLNLPRLSVLSDPRLATTVMLVPTVLRELDRHKVHHRNPAVSRKAASAIRRIKEYRRRGSLLRGVTDSKLLSVRAVATEPSREHYLSWLDPSNNDDRLIASTLHVAALACATPVYLLTADVNLQNKAHFAELACLDSDELLKARLSS